MEFFSSFAAVFVILILGFWLTHRIPYMRPALAPFVASCLLMLYLLIFACLNLLKFGTILLYVVALAGALWMIWASIKKKITIKSYFTSVGIIVFLISCIFLAVFYLLVKDSFFSTWDEYSHWGPFYKNVFIKERLHFFYDSPMIYEGYPRATTVFYYFTSFFLPQYSEPSAFVSIGILLSACSATLFGAIAWKNKLLSVLAVLSSLTLYVMYFPDSPYVTIYQDTLLGAIWGASLVLIISWEKQTLSFSFVLAAVLALLAQLKEIGLLFAVFTGGFYLIWALFEQQNKNLRVSILRNINKGFFLRTGIIIAGPLLSFAAWKVVLFFLGKNNIASHNGAGLSAFLSSFFGGLFGTNLDGKEVWKHFWDAMTLHGVILTPIWTTARVFPILLVLTLLTAILLYQKEKSIRLLLLAFSLPLIFLAYMAAIFHVVLTFGEFVVPATPRYISTGIIGWVLALLALILYYPIGFIRLQNLKKSFPLYQSLALTSMCFLSAYMVITWDALWLRFNKENMGRVLLDNNIQQLSSVLSEEDRVWVISQGDPAVSLNMYIYSYLLFPVYVPADNYLYNIADSEYFANVLRELKSRNINHILLTRSDKFLQENYGTYFSDGALLAEDAKEPVLYKVYWNGDGEPYFDLVLCVQPL